MKTTKSRSHSTAILITALTIAAGAIVASAAIRASEPFAAYQSQHIADRRACAVTVHGGSLVAIEDRTDCGGGWTPVIQSAEFAAVYVACMADVQPPVIDAPAWEIDSILWYGGLELWDTEGADCNGYLFHVPGIARQPLRDFGQNVRLDTIRSLAP